MSQDERMQVSSYSRFLEFIIYILFFLGPLMGNVIMVLLHVLSQDFQVSINAILIAIPAFMIPFAITQLFAGAISDIKGRIPVLIFGLLLFALAMLTTTLSFNLEVFIISNILAGIGFGFINPVLIALMSDFTSPSMIPSKMGYLGATANLGVGIGPLIASQMIGIGWRSVYILFFIITCFCLIYMFITKRPLKIISKGSSFKVLMGQISNEMQKKVVILLLVTTFVYSHTYLAVTIWTSRTLAGVVEESLTGIILGLAGVGGAIAGALAGNLIRKKGVRFTIFIGIVMMFFSIIVLITVGDITREVVSIPLAVGWIAGGFAGGILFTSMVYYSQVLSPERRGALAGLFTASYFIGIALVPITLSPFSDIFGITGVYIAIFFISIIYTLVILILSKIASSAILNKEIQLNL